MVVYVISCAVASAIALVVRLLFAERSPRALVADAPLAAHTADVAGTPAAHPSCSTAASAAEIALSAGLAAQAAAADCQPAVEVASFTTPGVTYHVWPYVPSCTCPHFTYHCAQNGGVCKHIRRVIASLSVIDLTGDDDNDAVSREMAVRIQRAFRAHAPVFREMVVRIQRAWRAHATVSREMAARIQRAWRAHAPVSRKMAVRIQRIWRARKARRFGANLDCISPEMHAAALSILKSLS